MRGVEVEEWRGVALRKWRHYRDNVRTSGNLIALSFHERGLAFLVPYLLGMSEEARCPQCQQTLSECDLMGCNGKSEVPSSSLLEVRENVGAIVREHLSRVGFYDNRDAWAEECTAEMVAALLRLPELGGDGRAECGVVYNDKTPPCSVPASWPHDEHSNGEWHWRTPEPKPKVGTFEDKGLQAPPEERELPHRLDYERARLPRRTPNTIDACTAGTCSHVDREQCLKPERRDGAS